MGRAGQRRHAPKHPLRVARAGVPGRSDGYSCSVASEECDQSGSTGVIVGPLFFLTVTIELEAEQPRVHLHPGGQGFWIARMIRVLGRDARLVSPVGGESGAVLTALMPDWEIELEAV